MNFQQRVYGCDLDDILEEFGFDIRAWFNGQVGNVEGYVRNALAQFLDEWIQRFPLATVSRYPDAGHYVFEDAYERMLPELQRFLARSAEQHKTAQSRAER